MIVMSGRGGEDRRLEGVGIVKGREGVEQEDKIWSVVWCEVS